MEKETLEKAAHEYFKRGQLGLEKAADTEMAFIKGAEWQAERMFSEEDIIKFLEWINSEGYMWNWHFKVYTKTMTSSEDECKRFGKTRKEILSIWKNKK